MKWFVWFFLSWSFFEPRSLSSESQLNYFLELIITGSFAANFNDTFHVAALCSNQASSHLEFLVVIYLNVEAASVLNVFVLVCRWLWLLSRWLLVLLTVWLLLLLLRVNILVSKLCVLLGWVPIALSLVVVRRLLAYVFLVSTELFLSLTFWYHRVVYPFHLQISIVLRQIKVVQRLLSEKCWHYIFEGY